MSPLRDASYRDMIVIESRQARARLHEKCATKLRLRIESRLKQAEAELSGLSELVQAQSWSLPRVPKALDDPFFHAPALQRWGRKAVKCKASTCHLCDAARGLRQRGVLCPTCMKSLRRITGSQRLSWLQDPDVREQVLTLTLANGKGHDQCARRQKCKSKRKLLERIQRLRNTLHAAVQSSGADELA